MHVVSVGSPVDLLDASRSLSNPHIIIFSIGAASVGDPQVRGKISLLRRHMSRIPLVVLSDRDDVDDIVEPLEHGVRGYIPTSLEPVEAAAALQCIASGGTFVPASAMVRLAQDRQLPECNVLNRAGVAFGFTRQAANQRQPVRLASDFRPVAFS
jgi:DNA-binding NarL/FixJ family response regulator